MQHASFSFEIGDETLAQPSRWTRGQVELSERGFDLDVHFHRSGGQGLYSTHSFSLGVEEAFSPECFVGILQLIDDFGFGASSGHICVQEHMTLSQDQSAQLDQVLKFRGLGEDYRASIPSTTAAEARLKLKRLAMLERIGAAL